MTNPSFVHEPVMADEIDAVFAGLDAFGPATFLDATVGGGGHAAKLLAAHPRLHLLGIDRDPDALGAAGARLESHGGRVTLRRARFDEVERVAADAGVSGFCGALFDLGVSSPQLDVPERGFSYRVDGPLDMRMDPDRDATADDVVNGYDRERLARVIADNSDERFARRIAAAICAARPVKGTLALAEIVRSAIPAPARRRGGHPAKRTFQAIRMEVNGELDALTGALPATISLLIPGARLAVLTYHSGEDRLVKAALGLAATGGCTCPRALGCVCGRRPTVTPVRAPRTPSPAEIAANPRARSARLRVVERVAAVPPRHTASAREEER
jgi:16S rRNA (cytosine1402-N4)-methyltransferase